MNKKSQTVTNIITFVLIILIAGLTINLGVHGLTKLNNAKKETEINIFVSTLEKTMKSQVQKPSGSMTPLTLSLPSEIEKVCFVDDSKDIRKQISIDLNKEKEIYEDRNLFFFPQSGFTPSKIYYISLNESTNPLCIKALNNKLNLRLTSLKDRTLVEAANEEEKDQGCIIVPGSEFGDSQNKIDIVYLGYGYTDKKKFSEDVIDYTNNYFFKTEPFAKNKERFNIWMVDKEEPECEIGDYAVCNGFSVNKITKECPNDYTFILLDKSKTTYSTRSSATSNMLKINTRDNRLVVLHEFAHLISNIADEYTDAYYEGWFSAYDYANCDFKGCDSWKDMQGTDCIKGCSTNGFFRSIDMSIMRNYDKSSEYGILNEKIIGESLDKYE